MEEMNIEKSLAKDDFTNWKKFHHGTLEIFLNFLKKGCVYGFLSCSSFFYNYQYSPIV